jgi:hypothetical protein
MHAMPFQLGQTFPRKNVLRTPQTPRSMYEKLKKTSLDLDVLHCIVVSRSFLASAAVC